MNVLFNPSVSNNVYQPNVASSNSLNTPKQKYTMEEIRTAKLKKTVSMLSLLAISTGILYFGFKKCAKTTRIKKIIQKEKELANIETPLIDKRALDITKYVFK